MIIEFKNGHLQGLLKVLSSLELSLKDSRMRTRFKNMLIRHGTEVIEPEVHLIVREFAILDENNQPVIADEETGRILFDNEEDELKAYEARKDLDEEVFPIKLDEYNKKMILSVGNALLNDENLLVNGDLADAVDEWCLEFEKAIEYYENPELESDSNEKDTKKKKKK